VCTNRSSANVHNDARERVSFDLRRRNVWNNPSSDDERGELRHDIIDDEDIGRRV